MHSKLKILLFLLVTAGSIFAQDAAQVQRYRSEPYGNIQFRREGLMDGNQERTIFYNNGEGWQWTLQPTG